MKLTGKKLLLILLKTPYNGKANSPIIGRTRLTKMVFLFKKELLVDFQKDNNIQEVSMPEFFAWNYGPFSKDLMNDLEFLINQEFIKVTYSNETPIKAELAEYTFWLDDINDLDYMEYNQEVFELTNKGIIRADESWNMLTNNQQSLLINFKKVLNNAPLDRILEYVYKKYDEQGYIKNSLIRDKYLS